MSRRRKRRLLKPRTPARVKKKTRKRKTTRGHQYPELVGLALAAFGLFLGSVVYAGWNGGYVGLWIAEGFDKLAGGVTYSLPVGFLAIGLLMLARTDLIEVRPFRTGLVVFTFGLLLTLGHGGGALGSLLAGGAGLAVGATGVVILGVVTLLAGTLLLTGASAGALLRHSGRAVHRAARRRVARPEPALAIVKPLHASSEPAGPPVDAVQEFPDLVAEAEATAVTQLLVEEAEPDQPSLFDAGPSTAVEYRLPDRELLRSSPPAAGTSAEAAARVAEALVQTLAHFGVDATVVGQIAGPRVTRYELQLAPGTKVSKVAALKDDLSYALATTEIRILAPIPGKQAVGVELPNLSPNLVTLGDIFDDLPATASPLSVWLGKDISGAAVWTDLGRMPHVLIAGTTGSGKSGCINTILTSILLRSTPDDVRFILIDPKKIELSYYESIPHLLTPVVSSPKEASTVLANVVSEMERRYERLSAVRARNLNEANRAFRSRGESTLPHLLVVIDELADLMMIAPQDVEDAVIRLAQKSRAVGIHLVLATQRPSVDVS